MIEEPTALPDDGPSACPFVAFEDDRDHRSSKADYRHRCFAAPEPEPRAFPHQERYCLSADFARCPIFRDWARQEAAAVKVAAAAAAAEGIAAAVATDGDVAPAFLAARSANTAAVEANVLSRRSPEPNASLWSYDEDGKRSPAPAAPTPPSSLGAPAVAMARRGPSHPGWENPPRLESFPRLRSREEHRANQPLLFVAIFLAIFMVALILFPIIISGKGGGGVGGGSPLPSVAAPTPTLVVSPSASANTNQAGWITYVVKSGDQMWAIARYFNITLVDLLAANPQIKDPSSIVPGQELKIPPIGWHATPSPS